MLYIPCQQLPQKLLQLPGLGAGEEFCTAAVFQKTAFAQKGRLFAGVAGEAHLMGDDHQLHSFIFKFTDDI